MPICADSGKSNSRFRLPQSSMSDLTRARWATRAQFLHLGTIAGVWGVHVPSLKARYALDERWLSYALLATSVGSLLTLVFAGRVVGRLGARNTTVVAGWCVCAALATLLVLPGLAPLFVAMLVVGAGESVYDVAINAEGTTLEQLSARPIMSGLHGMFSLGAMLGSATAALLLRAQIPAPTQLAAVAGVLAVSMALWSRGMLAVHPARSDESEVHFSWPRGALLIIGILIFLGMLAEGVMYNWSVLYVQQELQTPQERAALAYVAFAGSTAAMRFAGDWVRARVAERTMLFVLPTISAVAMLAILVIARPWPAIAGMGVVGIGLATIVPIFYNAATRVPGVSRAAAIASVSSIGYLGFMVGPPLIGGIADATTLSSAMAVLIGASVLLAIGSRWVPVARAAA
jgi:predicted MFS family arabinose efflux permease